ncbi:MAG TPA: Spo0B domain-containing protein [Bacillota bacterium]|nr:Spo0B domain-containing protein [Bacillota bacterium]
MSSGIKRYRTPKNDKPIIDAAICGDADECCFIEAERERSVESLKAHLSEQRHDFFNLLQVLYGYTQLKKPDKVLEHITDYCRQMENIGRLYNCKCIKLADLLYTKGKEADSIDLNFETSINVSFNTVVRMIDVDTVLNAVDNIISAFFYALEKEGSKNAHVILNLKENADNFRMEIYCMEIKNGQFDAIDSIIPKQEIYWEKTAKQIMCFDSIIKYCDNNGLEGKMLKEDSTFVLSIYK